MKRLLILLAFARIAAAQCVSPTTILGTDVVASSRSVINGNFTNLSACKAPLASPSFTGTVTVTGLGTGALKATSGAIALVSGSAGNCVHVDGSSGACTTGSVTAVTATSPVASTGGTTPVISCPTCVTTVPHPFGASFDGGGVAIAANATAYLHLPYGCTLQAWNIAVDTGTVTAKLWKIASGTAIPTSGNSINTSGIAISSGTNVRSTTLSDFTTSTITAHDIGAITLTAVSGATKAVVTIECQ